jgi:hypothetical protein
MKSVYFSLLLIRLKTARGRRFLHLGFLVAGDHDEVFALRAFQFDFDLLFRQLGYIESPPLAYRTLHFFHFVQPHHPLLQSAMSL